MTRVAESLERKRRERDGFAGPRQDVQEEPLDGREEIQHSAASAAHTTTTVSIADCAADGEPVGGSSVAGLIELILKDRRRLHVLIRDRVVQPELVPRFLAIALAGFLFYGVAMAIVLNAADVRPRLASVEDWLDGTASRLIAFAPPAGEAGVVERWLDPGLLALPAAYCLGLIAATGVCLPSLYFYGLLSGVRMSMLDVTVHALKAKATGAVALVGILPVYAAIGMAAVVFRFPPAALEATLLLGLVLPFLAGLWGSYSLYEGFATLCDTLPAERRERRACFLRRLVFSWCACYTAVSPVMIFTLWEAWG